MNTYQAKQIQITDFLQKNGITPVSENIKEAWYHSPLTGNDKTPSFKVNKHLNLFNDFSSGEKGTIIDLGLKMYNCSISELLRKLESSNFSFHQQKINTYECGIKIIKVKPITNNHLITYGNKRCISTNNLKQYCQEVTYSIDGKYFYALGFQNMAEGWEIRNEYYKAAIAPKTITIVATFSPYIAVFEGFFDFLSFLHLDFDVPKKMNYLILNSTSLVQTAIPHLNRHLRIYLFLDNDKAGKNATQKIKDVLSLKTTDCSNFYNGFKDLNEFLCNRDKYEIRI